MLLFKYMLSQPILRPLIFLTMPKRKGWYKQSKIVINVFIMWGTETVSQSFVEGVGKEWSNLLLKKPSFQNIVLKVYYLDLLVQLYWRIFCPDLSHTSLNCHRTGPHNKVPRTHGSHCCGNVEAKWETVSCFEQYAPSLSTRPTIPPYQQKITCSSQSCLKS